MIVNYLKTAFRYLMKQKGYSFINIFGLSLGLTACILIGLYIYQELHYDDFHANSERIYRATINYKTPDGIQAPAQTPALFAPSIHSKFPDIEKVSRIYFSSDNMIKAGSRRFYEDAVIFADPGFFDIFSYQVLQGNETRFLKQKNTIVLTRQMAKKYFGDDNPVGRTITLDNKIDLEVTGIIDDVPVMSHFTFSMVVTYETINDLPEGNYLDQWGATFGSYTYVMLKSGVEGPAFQKKLTGYMNEIMPLVPGIEVLCRLQPIKSIHLHSHLSDEIQPSSSVRYLFILGIISFFILSLACINYINLTTARSVKRAREIGVRKVFGAFKHQLIRQFLCESIITTFIALGVALLFVEYLKPLFAQLIGTPLTYHGFENYRISLIIFSGTVLLGIIAGLYPAFILTRYEPIQVIKGTMNAASGKKGAVFLRKGLVVFQFSISVILILFTLVINRQVSFMRNFDMGFNQEHILVLKTPERLSSKEEAIKNELLALPMVSQVSASLGAPVFEQGFGTNLIPDLKNEQNSFVVAVKMIDYDYLDLYDIELVAGQRLSDFPGRDGKTITLVNETATRDLGFVSASDAIGHAYTIGLSDGHKRFKPEIVGVVKDFHFRSLHEEIRPLLFLHWPALFQEISVKINPGRLPSTIKAIRKIWKQFYPEHPFVYHFLDEKIDQLYKSEERSFRIITIFSILALLIACLGFIGLTIYTTDQRKKEIGIRKVLGASVRNIIHEISMEYLKLVVLANIIAWPLSYLMVRSWLADFPYKTGIDILLFVFASGAVLVISSVTIAYIVYSSAMRNPIDTIRYE